LDTHLNDNADLLGKSCDNIGIDADIPATEDLTRELQHHALVRIIHPSGSPLRCWSCSRDADARSSM